MARVKSPTVWRLPSYSGPEICECREQQISQLDHGRLWVTREPSSHLPDQQLCETTLQLQTSHCLTCIYFHAGWGTFRKRLEVGHVAFRHFPGSVYSMTLDDWEFPSSSTSIIRTTCMTFRLRQPHTWCGTPVTIGRGPVAIPADAMATE